MPRSPRRAAIARLGEARRDILAARRNKRRISDIALDRGVSHWGRFSGTYRAFFGETPSQTLRSGAGDGS